MTYEQNLTQMGLTNNEALVYDALLTLGKAGVKELLRQVPVKRANLYAVLYALKNKGLVVEIEEKGKKKFKPESPNKLAEMVEHEEHKLKQASAALDATLPLLVSQYNLASGKPSV
ncbi:MAG: helix-turn-helix domain-containing protein, partial [Candidatus Paceibacterota bacterium]